MKLIISLTLCVFACGINCKSLSRNKRQQENPKPCICVPYYICTADNVIDTTGQFVLEQRIDLGNPNPTCNGEVEVCCSLPDSGSTELPMVTEVPENQRVTTNRDENGFSATASGPEGPDNPEEPVEVTPISTPEKFPTTDLPQFPWQMTTKATTARSEINTERTITDEPNGKTDPNGPRESTIPLPVMPDGVSGCGIRRQNPLESRFGLSTRITSTDDFPEESTFFGEAPWMVAVLNEKKGEKLFVCGGSLVAPNIVLTAAHCVLKLELNQIVVRAGDWDSLNIVEPLPHQERKIKKVVIHKEFNSGSLHNDIALLFVDRPFDLNDNVDIICIDKIDFKPENCFATGWGAGSFGEKLKDDKSKGLYQPVMKKVDLPIVDRDTCQRVLRLTRLGRFFELHKSFMCAGGEVNRDTCTGDGGGPLVCSGGYTSPHKYSQVGIVSWGIGCGSEHPAVYTSVNYFYDWIKNQINS